MVGRDKPVKATVAIGILANLYRQQYDLLAWSENCFYVGAIEWRFACRDHKWATKHSVELHCGGTP